MYTSVGLLALANFFAPLQTSAALPSWNTSYAAAQDKAAQLKRPLVVVVGAGQDGFQKVSRDGKLSDDAGKLLADHYVCVYLDQAKPQEAALAKQLAITSGHGIVISDRTGSVQAFHHDGTLSGPDLTQQLRHFANPAVEVRTTQTNGISRTSFYPSIGTGAAPAMMRNC